MGEFDDMLKDGLSELREMEGGPMFTYPFDGDTEYPCTAGSAGDGKDLGLGGWATSADLLLIVQLADLAGANPLVKQSILYLQKKYRIEHRLIPPGQSFMALACVDPTKGA